MTSTPTPALPPKYNPAFMSDSDLGRLFVVRHKYVDLILENILENNGPANQHILVVGPRGIGKTTLVLKVAAEVRQRPEFRESFYPVVFAEEAYEISTPGEFWLETLRRIADQSNSEKLRAAYSDVKLEVDEVRLRERALAQVIEYAQDSRKRLLLIIENLNMLLKEQLSDRAAWDLRHTLLNENRVMLLATALSRFAAIDNAGKAWFELFTIYTLEPLSAAECNDVFRATTGHSLPEGQSRAVQILTGGNPRLVRVLADFSNKKSFRDLLADLIHLVDEHTEYFKSQIDSLPSMERKVFVSLLDLWAPVSALEVARNARLTVSKASAYLNRLVSRGGVTVIRGAKRKTLYQATERLYNIYYLLRRNGHPSARVRAAVRFMTYFYRGSQVITSTAELAKEACALELPSRGDHLAAYQQILNDPISAGLRSAIIRATPKEFFSLPDLPEEIRRLSDTQEHQHMRDHGLSKISKELFDLLALGQESQKNGDYEKAEMLFRSAVALAPKDGHALAHLGFFLFFSLRKYSEAKETLNRATDLNPSDSWAWLIRGKLAIEMGDEDVAATVLRQCIALQPTNSEPWIDLAYVLHEIGDYTESAVACRKVIEIGKKSNTAYAWARLAELLHFHLDQRDEAEEAYKNALVSRRSDAKLLMNYAQLLGDTGRSSEAKDCLAKARQTLEKQVKSHPNDAMTWSNLGQLYAGSSDTSDLAENAIRKAFELDPENTRILSQLSDFLADTQKWDGAVQVLRSALKIRPQDYRVWTNLGWALQQINDTTGAEAAYKRAIEIYSGYSPAVAALSGILMTQQRWPEAWELAALLFEQASNVGLAVDAATDFAVSAAAAGFSQEIIKLLENSKGRGALEPLEVGIRQFLGEDVVAPKEISEIAQDIVERIRNLHTKSGTSVLAN